MATVLANVTHATNVLAKATHAATVLANVTHAATVLANATHALSAARGSQLSFTHAVPSLIEQHASWCQDIRPATPNAHSMQQARNNDNNLLR